MSMLNCCGLEEGSGVVREMPNLVFKSGGQWSGLLALSPYSGVDGRSLREAEMQAGQ